jgi:hypothetical protein
MSAQQPVLKWTRTYTTTVDTVRFTIRRTGRRYQVESEQRIRQCEFISATLKEAMARCEALTARDGDD